MKIDVFCESGVLVLSSIQTCTTSS